MFENYFYIIISLLISAILFFIIRFVINKKLRDLTGNQKLLGIASLIILISESVYLGTTMGLFEFALEIVTSVGVGMVIFGIALQHQLKNIVSGVGIYFNSDINIGDLITIKETKGVITEIHLTKIIALTEDGGRIIIPTQKFAEDFVIIHSKNRRSDK
jgi:small-conductance mechanosensitive channel